MVINMAIQKQDKKSNPKLGWSVPIIGNLGRSRVSGIFARDVVRK